jgi:hypothetical protein
VNRSLSSAAGLLALLVLGMSTSPSGAQDIMPAPTPSPTGTPTPTPRATPAPVPPAGASASTSDQNVAANAIDGNPATRWSGYGNGAWLELDLGTVVQVAEVEVSVFRGDTRRNKFDLEISSDRVQWTPVLSGGSTALTTSPQRYTFFERYARYVRYVGRGSVSSTGETALWNSLNDVRVLSLQNPSQPRPQTLTASTIYDAGAVMLQWSVVTGASSYHVYRRQPGTEWTRITSTSMPSFTNWGLSDGVRYCYAVSSVAYNYLGATESFFSNEACAVGSVMPFPPPPVPTNLRAEMGTVGCDGFVTRPLTLTWDPSPGATSYGVWKAVAGGAFERIATVTATQYSISTVSFGFYAVSASNGTLSSQRSPTVYGTFAIPGCPLPIDLTPGAAGVSASGHDGNVPANAVDRNLQTRWSAEGDGAWLQFDLGSTRMLATAQIAVHRGDQRQNRFDIQVSSDRETWTTVFTGLSPQLINGLQTINLVDTPGRYVRYLGHGCTDPDKLNWNSVAELRVFGY